MDIFKFNSPTAPTKLEQGQIVNGLKSKMWIERYRRTGEFSFVADVRSGAREALPIGSIISHTETTEIMVVENHEISDDRDKNSEIIISGRGFESYFEHRVVGEEKDYSVTQSPSDYQLLSAYTWDQAVTLIKEHIYNTEILDLDNELPYVTVSTDISGTDGTSAARKIKTGELYKAFVDILDVDDLGVKVIRPGPWSPLGSGSPNIAVVVHRGVDRSSQVIFSHDTGEIESAEYLWSNKRLKNCAIVSGKHVEVFVEGTATKYDRRIMHVEADDIDESYSSMPTGTDLIEVQAALTQRGLEALASQKAISLAKTEVSKALHRSVFRKDYDVGDIVMVSGDYNASKKMRVEEYVEIEDQNGSQGYPTLATIEEES